MKRPSLFLKFIPLLLILALTACAGTADGGSSPSSSDTVSGITSSVSVSGFEDYPASRPSQEESYKDTNLIIMSDVHLCTQVWYGVDSDTRMKYMIEDLNEYYKTEKYSSVFLLGDLSLDHWLHNEGGSWLNSKTSNTKNLIEKDLSNLDCGDFKMIPGNHEQYSNAQWKEITGYDRQYYVYTGGYLFIMLDNFQGELNPNYHHDGKYTQTDVNFIKLIMSLYPDAPVVLCAHWFDTENESEAFKSLVRNEERILCMFVGHDHTTVTVTLDEEWGGKKVIHNGNFSYTSADINQPQNKWGWRRLRLTRDGIDVAYYSPSNSYEIKGNWITSVAAEYDQTFIKNPLAK